MQRTVQRDLYRLKYSIDDDDDRIFTEETWNKNKWRNEYNSPRTIFSHQEEVNPSFQVRGDRTPIKPTQLYLLRKGDHVGWHRPYLIWHHAIVTDIDTRYNRIQVIHFTKKGFGNYVIEKEWKNVTNESGDFFRFNYSEETIFINPPRVVLERAHDGIGEKGYRFFTNNCEHFATYCKTGKKDSAQVHWFGGKLRETVQTSASNIITSVTKIASSVSKEVVRQGCKGAAESTAKIGGAEALELASKTSNLVGAGIVVAIEAVHCAYDIYQMHKNKKAGKITSQDFKQSTTQRISEGVCGSGLAIAGGVIIGGFIGSAFPGVGTLLGSVFGGILGSLVGKVCGSLFGQWLGRKIFR